jgi:flagellin
MSGIVLSASVRQNLLSLQSTADLLASTQNALATGKKVNSALDNPTNFFTAQGLDNRASDIGNLLDGIGNGVQVLQAANTGITSLQSLISSAKSIANQALQTTIGYSTKSNVSTTITGATAADLRGTTTFASSIASSNVLYTGAAGGNAAATAASTLGSAAAATLTGTAVLDNTGTGVAITAGTKIFGATGALTTTLATSKFADGDVFTINGKTVTVKVGSLPTSVTGNNVLINTGGATPTNTNVVTDGSGNSTVYLNTATTVSDFLTAFDVASGVQSVGTVTVGASGNTASTAAAAGQTPSTIGTGLNAGKIILSSSTGQDLTLTGKADDLAALGLTASTGSGNATVQAFRTTGTSSLNTFIQAGSTLNVDGKVITFKDGAAPPAASLPTGSSIIQDQVSAGPPPTYNNNIVTDGNGNSTVYLQTANLGDVLTAVDLATGVQSVKSVSTGGVATLQTASGQTNSSVNASGELKLSTGVNADLSVTGTGNALSVLGLAGNTGTATAFTAARQSGIGGISGKTLTFSSFNGGSAVNVTFGDGTNGTVKSLDQLNTALGANNLIATLDAKGNLTISASNDFASSTLGSAASGGAIGGSITSALTFSTASAPVADPVAQATRTGLVAQYNNILQQIDSTAQDSSFNGVNLLNGDQLKLVFDETGKSSLNITGVTFNTTGLGLSSLTQGADFIDNAATNKVLTSLNTASSTLRSEASALGSNLSIVQVRQDFNKSLIDVLQTGSSNLTLADTNQEAANSQALSTRQSIAVSALSLANQSQQSVLQLLR